MSNSDAAQLAQDEIWRVQQAIWGADPGSIMQLPQADPGSWAGSVQLDARTYGPAASLSRPMTPAAEHRGIAVVMMVKDEEDIIGHNLEWLHYVGVRRFVIADNQSSDGTREGILGFQARHPDCEVIVVDDPVVSYVQSVKTTRLLRQAISTWPDLRWVFPIDADEFLIPSRGFGPLDELPDHIDAMTIQKVIHSRHSLGGEVDTGSPLGLMALRSSLFWVPPKSACRAREHFAVTPGNHYIASSAGGSPVYQGAFALGLYYREFQVRSFEHFLRKVGNGGQAILAAKKEGRAEGGDHWLRYFEVLSTAGESGMRKLYEDEFVRGGNPGFTLDPFYGCYVP